MRERLAAASHSLPSSPNERNGGDTIAIYHCSIKIVSRGKGKSAVAAAAYRSGEKLTNEWDGMTHDYTRKGGVVKSIHVQKGATVMEGDLLIVIE